MCFFGYPFGCPSETFVFTYMFVRKNKISGGIVSVQIIDKSKSNPYIKNKRAYQRQYNESENIAGIRTQFYCTIV